jgi:hypothetical protein
MDTNETFKYFHCSDLTILAQIIKYIKILLDEMLLREIFKVVGKKKFDICLGQ